MVMYIYSNTISITSIIIYIISYTDDVVIGTVPLTLPSAGTQGLAVPLDPQIIGQYVLE